MLRHKYPTVEIAIREVLKIIPDAYANENTDLSSNITHVNAAIQAVASNAVAYDRWAYSRRLEATMFPQPLPLDYMQMQRVAVQMTDERYVSARPVSIYEWIAIRNNTNVHSVPTHFQPVYLLWGIERVVGWDIENDVGATAIFVLPTAKIESIIIEYISAPPVMRKLSDTVPLPQELYEYFIFELAARMYAKALMPGDMQMLLANLYKEKSQALQRPSRLSQNQQKDMDSFGHPIKPFVSPQAMQGEHSKEFGR